MLEEFRAEILSIAVWGSLTASFLLATYLLVQALVDLKRRAPYTLLAIICIANALNDYFYADVGHQFYEKMRLAIWALYPLPLLWALGFSWLKVIAPTCLLATTGALIWLFGNPLYATSFIIPGAFIVSCFAHLNYFTRNQGFSSAILASTSLITAGMCALYLQVVGTGQSSIISFGYLHYSLVCLIAVLFGWTQLPREVRGGLPVRVPLWHFVLFITIAICAEIGVQCSLLGYAPQFNLPLYVGSSLSLIAACLIFFFYHRHQLVIYTDNIAQLLQERTQSLKIAQGELSASNAKLAQQLAQQTVELTAHAQTIERQKRLEIVAQISGQTAHDIQNLLSPISYHSEKIKLSLSPEHKAALNSINVINQQIEDLLELNSQFLTLSRRGRLDLKAVNIKGLIDECKNRFPSVSFTKINTDVWIFALWSQISRALSNLITNALEASIDTKEPVCVSVSLISPNEPSPLPLGQLQLQEYVRIEVRDRGSGIPEQAQHRIFDPFYSSKTGQKGSGTGLGLTVVRSVVEDYQGALDFDSSTQGTVFTLYFPRAAAPSNIVELTDLCGNETIAVIDDDRDLLRNYERFLEAAGYTVRLAASKREAIELFRCEHIHAALIDINLGSDKGIDVLFAAIHLRPGIRSIIQTSLPDSLAEREFYSLGATETIIKPAAPSQVLRAIRNALRESEQQSVANE